MPGSGRLLSILHDLRQGSRSLSVRSLIFGLGIFLSLVPVTTRAAGLSGSQARTLITRVGGFELKRGAVHVKQVSSVDTSTMVATAEIELAFRFERSEQYLWRVAEVRSGQDRWEEISFIVQAVQGELNETGCDQPDLTNRKKASTDLTVKRARCLLANLLGVQLPSDAVRIKSVSPLGLPLGSQQSALVDAFIEADFRITKDQGSWRLNGIRTGGRGWADTESILNQVNKEKAGRAQSEMQAIAKALEAFRARRGYYVEAKNEAVLIDFLSPDYLSHVTRLDPWRRPYQYEGTRDHFTLKSAGPDGKENTSDDIVLGSPTRSAARATIR